MSGQRHAILRQTFELTVATGEDAWPLQQEARHAQAGVARLLERCCDELSMPDCLHRIDRLELDLGVLDPQRFEEDFLAKMAPALRDSLAAAIGRLDADGSSPRYLAQWELLSQYLRLGRLPWWADLDVASQPQASLTLLVQEAPDLLRNRMAPLLADLHVLTRLAGHFADRQLVQLAALLLPQLDSYPGTLALTLIPVAVSVSERNIPGGWRSRIWQSVLGNAVPASAAALSRLDYSRSVLMRLVAGRLGDYRELIWKVQAHAASVGTAGTVAMATTAGLADVQRILAQLSGELSSADHPHAAPCALSTPHRDSVPSEQAASPEMVRTEVASLPGLPLTADIGASDAAEGTVSGQVECATTLVSAHLCSERTEVATLPGLPLAANIDAGDAADSAILEDRSASTLETVEHLPLPVSAGGASSADIVRQLRQRRTTTADFADADTDVDAIPVSNAGLVILWPFLKTFLERLDLLDKNDFRDETARQRAAILLQCLASGEVEVPEYLLPLNKVLCGLPLDAPCEIDDPLLAEEIDGCEQLLMAVIDQVPILNKMSVAGFRTSFLLRDGMLDIRDGAWLLRVERETHDLVLDRFPWGFQWVKLPWMDAPLQVEW